MRVLVTGATGFIGRHLIDALLNSGHEVMATSRNRSNKGSRLFSGRPVTYIPFDMHEAVGEDLYAYFKQPDCLIHLAWSGLPNYQDLFHFETNVSDSYLFLKNLVEHGLKHIVAAGTCLEYGMKNGSLSEDLVPQPTTPYGIAKHTLHSYLVELQKQVPFVLQWVRLFYTYGVGQSPNAILSQLDAALERDETEFNMSGGEQLRDYLAVEKVGEIISTIGAQTRITGIINCCSGTPISIRRLVEQHLGKKGRTIKLNLGYYPYPDYEPMAFWGDTTKLRTIIEGV